MLLDLFFWKKLQVRAQLEAPWQSCYQRAQLRYLYASLPPCFAWHSCMHGATFQLQPHWIESRVMPLTSVALRRHGDKSNWSTSTVTIQIPPTVLDVFRGTGGVCNPVPCAAVTTLMGLSASSPNLMRREHVGLPASTRKPFKDSCHGFILRAIFL